jgi:hypothetical protein
MASPADVRQWAAETGRGKQRGRLAAGVIADWNDAHPGDPYVAPPPREGFFSGDEMEDLFGDAPEPDPGGPSGTGETRPRPVPKSRSAAPSGGLRGLFGGKPKGKGKKPPRVSVESLLGSAWRGAAKLAAPLPPLHRTLRVQAPVAGLLLEDAVKDTAADAFLQPFARMAGAGKVVSALLGPPVLVTGITLHVTQAQQRGDEPNPVLMAVAQEALRSSLMTWMDVAGPKFEEAIERERQFEETYGAGVDAFMAWLFSAPPATAADHEAEEEMYRRAMQPAGAGAATM